MANKKSPQSPSPARRVAFTLMLVIMIGLAFTFPMTLSGNIQGALIACGIATLVGLAVLILGTLIVASARSRDSGDASQQ